MLLFKESENNSKLSKILENHMSNKSFYEEYEP